MTSPAPDRPTPRPSPAAARSPTGRPTRLLEPADLTRLRSVVDVALHPGGRAAVVVVGWPDAETDANRSVLEACSIDDGASGGIEADGIDADGIEADGIEASGEGGLGAERRRLTDGHRDHKPRFSPDGSRLAFVRRRPTGPTGIMVLDWATGAMAEVADLADGVDDLAWAGDRLVVLAPRRPVGQDGIGESELAQRPRILSRIQYRFDGRGWTHDRPRQVLVIDDPAPGAGVREIGRANIDHSSIAPSPDGRWVAVTAATDDDHDLTGCTDAWLLPIGGAPGRDDDPRDDGGGSSIRLTEPGGTWSDVVWHPEGVLVGIGRVDAGRVGFQRPHRIPLPDLSKLADLPELAGLNGQPGPGTLGGVSGPAVLPLTAADQHIKPAPARDAVPVDGGFLFPGTRRGRVAVDRYGLDGSHEVVHQGDHQVLAFDATLDGSVVVGAVTSPNRPAELWRLDGRPRRLLGLNDALLAAIDLATVEEVTVTSADGTDVHGFVVTPPAGAPVPAPAPSPAPVPSPAPSQVPESAPASAPGGRPGLIYVHGGPMFQYGLGFFDEFQMAAACGYVVIGGNPRGSDGYGEEWARSIVGDLGDRDWADVTALADNLAARPDVDADRLGIGGGSYGGFMTGWALARDRRFKAGLIERAVTSWSSMFGTSDIGPWFTEQMIGASIESDAEEVRRQSPLTYASDIEAPTLIIHSEEDWRCPIEQGEQLFAAIRRNGGEATMVRFPGECHELSRSGRPSHRIERFEIIHEFFARHLGGSDFGSDHLRPRGARARSR